MARMWKLSQHSSFVRRMRSVSNRYQQSNCIYHLSSGYLFFFSTRTLLAIDFRFNDFVVRFELVLSWLVSDVLLWFRLKSLRSASINPCDTFDVIVAGSRACSQFTVRVYLSPCSVHSVNAVFWFVRLLILDIGDGGCLLCSYTRVNWHLAKVLEWLAYDLISSMCIRKLWSVYLFNQNWLLVCADHPL